VSGPVPYLPDVPFASGPSARTVLIHPAGLSALSTVDTAVESAGTARMVPTNPVSAVDA
jgi:hypothetical protein